MTRRQPHSAETGVPFDARDRLILALHAQIKAERETREAMEEAIRHGALSSEVLVALASDPVPVITDQDVAEIETLLDRDAVRQQRRQRGRAPGPLGVEGQRRRS